MKSRSISAFLFILVAAAGARTQAPPVAALPGIAESADVRRAAFEKVWTTVNEKHYDPTFGGVDWKKVRAVYEPNAYAAKTNDEFHAVIRAMLGELKLSHFGVYTVPKPDAAKTVGGSSGINFSLIDGRPFIKSIDPVSPAASSAAKPGFELKSIDGRTVADLLKHTNDYIAASKSSTALAQIYRESALRKAADGASGTFVSLRLANANGKPVDVKIERYSPEYEMSEPIGNFPPQEVVFESRLLDGNIGYIRFNQWLIPQMPKIRAAVREFSRANGIIFDIRGNPGGLGGMASGVAGFLVTQRTSLGSMRSRESVQNFIVYPQAGAFTGKVVILTDHGSASTSEVFAVGLQEIGRATVIGETTAGAVLPSVFDTLPTGAIFQWAVSDYRSPKNVLIEGRGVHPDVIVKQTRAALIAGRDLPIEAAVKLITK